MYILISKKQLNDKHRETKWQSADIYLPFKPLGLFFYLHLTQLHMFILWIHVYGQFHHTCHNTTVSCG